MAAPPGFDTTPLKPPSRSSNGFALAKALTVILDAMPGTTVPVGGTPALPQVNKPG
ncbi:hypothetical protein D9M70_626150 [compost metagenome]